MFVDVLIHCTLEFLGWREVHVDNSVLGPLTKKVVPSMLQFVIKNPVQWEEGDDDARDVERAL